MQSGRKLPRSNPDLTQRSMESNLDSSSSSSVKSSSRSSLHKSSPAENNCKKMGDSPSPSECNSLIGSPIRCPRKSTVRHNRSLSFRNMKRPTQQQIQSEDWGFRPRVATMPSDTASHIHARRRMRSARLDHHNLTPSPPVQDNELVDADDDYYLLRSFSITSKGGVVNRGDFFRQRSRSNNSVASTGSSITTPGGNGTSGASNATSCSSGQWRGPARRVIMMGAGGVGKTALVTQFMTSEYMNAYETEDDDMEKCVSVLLDGDEYELLFLDSPSPNDKMPSPRLFPYAQVKDPNPCAKTECRFNLPSSKNRYKQDSSIFDTSERTFYSTSSEKDNNDDPEADAYIVVYSVTERRTFEKATDILFGLREQGITINKAVILVGNKADLARSREISTDEGKSVACSYECKFTETSACINHNVDELLVGVVSQIRLKNRQKEDLQNFSPLTRKSLSKGSLRSSLRARGIFNKLLRRGSGRSKSCDNLHVL